MDEIKKKILIGSGLILFGLLGAYGIYYFFLRTPKTPPQPTPAAVLPTTSTAPRGGLPTAKLGIPPGAISVPTIAETPTTTAPAPLASPIATGGLTTIAALTTDKAIAPIRAPSSHDLTYYNPDNGKFFRVTPQGDATALTNQVFRNVEKIAWAPNTTKAVLEFPDGANVVYDFAQKKQITLPKHWKDFSFSPQGDAIVFKSIGLDPEDRWLVIANPDGSNATAVEPLGKNADKVNVNWSPNQQMIGTMVESRDGIRQELFFIGKNGENFRLAVLEGRQFIGQWTPKGDRMLYSVYSPATNFNPSLWMVDASPGASGENRQHLDVATWADKCTFASDNRTAYCAVPKTLPQGAGIVRDVARDIADNFYRVDTATGAKTLLAEPKNDVSAINLIVAQDGSQLFFTDTKTGTLKKLQLR